MSMTDQGRAYIEHFGVKGMRWGVRRSKNSVSKGSEDSGGSSSKSDDSKESGGSSGGGSSNASGTNSRAPKKSVAEMSDTELKAYVNRIQMEQQYARMQPTPLSKKAAKFAGEVLVGVARQQLTNSLNSQLNSALSTKKAQLPRKKARKAGVPDAPGRRLITAPPTTERVG